MRPKTSFSPARGWLIWGIATLFVVYQLMMQNGFGAIAGNVQTDLGLSIAGMGMLSASFLIVYSLMQLPVGLILDRTDARWVLGLSAITVPWGTLVLSVILYIVIPVIAAQVMRRRLLATGGQAALDGLLTVKGQEEDPGFDPDSSFAFQYRVADTIRAIVEGAEAPSSIGGRRQTLPSRAIR